MTTLQIDDSPARPAREQEMAARSTRFDPGDVAAPGDAARRMRWDQDFARLTVRDVMPRNVRSCRPDDTLAAAAAAMREVDCRVLPVVDRMGHPIGIVSGESICLTGASDPQLLLEIDVRDAMSRLPATCRENDPVSDALKIMRDRHLHQLPVVDAEGVLEGFLSLNHLMMRLEEKGSPERAVAFAPLGTC